MIGSSSMVLMAQVARRYYLGRQSKKQIGDELGLSRFQVARLIDSAILKGIVRIQIGIPGEVLLGLSAELREAFGLEHCVIVDPPDETESSLRHHIGLTTTQLLTEIVGPGDVLGISSTRVLMGLTEPVARFANCPVVQITGALSRPDASDVMEAVRQFTRAGGGPAYVFYAPLICRSEAALRTYYEQPDVTRCMQLFPEVSVSVTGIGAWKPGLSTVYDASSSEDRRTCLARGVTTEIAGILVGADGRAVSTPLSERLIGMSEKQLRRVPTRIGVAFDRRKAGAVRTVLTSHLINSLVTHRSLAEAILNGA